MLQELNSSVSAATDGEIIKLSVQRFPSVKPKFTVEDWDSGEGGESDHTGESEKVSEKYFSPSQNLS
ncbi:MAG: hypothetical protein F6K10_35125 [Moorea sp. SIO2B7]|nr:hypothetical protein [Moorena sp. SIO2B7]